MFRRDSAGARSRRHAPRSVRAHWPVLLFAMLGLSTLSGCIRVELFGSRGGPLVETRVAGTDGPKIVMIDIDGVIHQEATASYLSFTESTVARVREQLDAARNDAEVGALLLRVDTPGGSATASDILYTEILRFKQERGIPVLAHFLGMATSGGYYVAMAADEIVAEPTNVTGSIGVLMIGLSIEGLMEKFGVVDETITAGSLKDAGSPFRNMTEQEREIFQGVTDDLHERFRTVVAAGRPNLSREQIVAASDGRIFSAPKALELGLVDSIGSMEDTVAKVRARLGVEDAVVVSYHRRGEWRRNLYTRTPAEPPTAGGAFGGLHFETTGLSRMILPGFHYLWWPGMQR